MLVFAFECTSHMPSYAPLAGVRVQEAVIGFINKVRNGKPPKDDETGSDGSGVAMLPSPVTKSLCRPKFQT